MIKKQSEISFIMRVFLITSKLNFTTAGGSVTDLHLKAFGLKKMGHEVIVVTAYSFNNKINSALPYQIITENIVAGNYLSKQWRLHLLLKKYEKQADVFYIDGNNFLYGAAFYKILGGQTSTVLFFNMLLNCWRDPHLNIKTFYFFSKFKRRLRFFLEKYIGTVLVNKNDIFIYNTPMVENIYRQFGFRRPGFILEDFVDTEEIMQTNHINLESIANKQKNDGVIKIYCSGRLYSEKGFDLVIKAFFLLDNKNRYQLIIGGDGPEKIH